MIALASSTEQAERDLVRYVATVTPHFDALRTLSTQLAGFLLSVTLDPTSDAVADAPIASVEDTLKEAREGLLTVRKTDQTSHHHRHLLRALEALQLAHEAIRAHLPASRRARMASACEQPLNEAIAHLHHASRALPGVGIVDLTGACCAWHPATIGDPR